MMTLLFVVQIVVLMSVLFTVGWLTDVNDILCRTEAFSMEAVDDWHRKQLDSLPEHIAEGGC